MTNKFLPPPIWFETALEIIEFARERKSKDDFIIDSKLRPIIVGQSYSYRLDVMQSLIRFKLVNIEDDKLIIGTSFDVDWLVDGLKSGNEYSWKLANAVDVEVAIAKKFSAEELKRIGDMGEQFVLNKLKEHHPIELHKNILHVASNDDTLGYDISAPTIHDAEQNALLEVKTSVRKVKGKFEFFLSKNEFEVGMQRKNWCIVAVSIVDDVPHIVGHIYSFQFDSRVPKNVDADVCWTTCKIRIEFEVFRPGLP